jgi:hypothetical protein
MTATKPDDSQDSRRALAGAFEDVLKAEAERREAARRPVAPRKPWFGIVSLVILASAVGWLAVDRPAWLFPAAVAENPAREDAGLRLTMYAAATRLHAYRDATRRYPPRLEDIPGIATRDLRYERLSDTVFVLRGRRGGAVLTLNSRDPLEPFLGSTLARTLQRSGR